MKRLSLLSLTLCILLGWSCKKNVETETYEPLPPLKGTKWKLEYIFHYESNTFLVLEPRDCEECYTLTFDTDTTAIAQSANSRDFDFFKLIFSGNKVRSIMPSTGGGESLYAFRFRMSINSLIGRPFSISESEMKLYFALPNGMVCPLAGNLKLNPIKNYLLFKQIVQ